MPFDPGNPYNNQRWRKERATFLRRNPFCIFCKQMGQLKIAEVVNHKIPHKGDEALFWNHGNWQALCVPCHNSAAAIKDSKGVAPGCREDGTPLDPDHPWNK